MSGVTVEQVEATASDVEAPLSDLLNEPDVVAGQVDGSFVVPYTYFNPYLPEGMTISTEEGDARISGELALTELGRSIPVSSGVEFTVDGDVLTVTPVDIQIGDLPIDLGDQVADALGFSAQVPELPLGLSVTEMEATSSGLRILEEVAVMVEGVTHVEIDAESHLELVRRLEIRGTPTVFVLDASGRIVRRAQGQPRKADVIAALGRAVL